jgi:chromosome segregation ATPase
LEIKNCPNLEKVICSRNQLTELNLQGFPRLKTLICNDNKLTSLDLSNSKELEDLNIMNNSFAEQNLSLLGSLTKLKELRLGNNRFHDSLEPLKNISGLKLLDIRNTDISRGLEHLPESIDFFNCLADIKKDAQVKKIYDLFANEQGEVELLTEPNGFIKDFPAKLRAYKQKITEGIKDDKGKEIQQLKDKISELGKQLADAKNEGQKDKQEIENLKNQIKDLEGKLSSTDQAKEIEELKKTLDVNRKFTNTLSDNIVRLETEISESKLPGQQPGNSVEVPQQIAQIIDNPPLKKD